MGVLTAGESATEHGCILVARQPPAQDCSLSPFALHDGLLSSWLPDLLPPDATHCRSSQAPAGYVTVGSV